MSTVFSFIPEENNDESYFQQVHSLGDYLFFELLPLGNIMKSKLITLSLKILISIVGAIGILAFEAFWTGSHITDRNGRMTARLFILLAFVIWTFMEFGNMDKKIS